MAARPCTYTFTDNDGNELTLGLDDFKAYLAKGGLEELLPQMKVPWENRLKPTAAYYTNPKSTVEQIKAWLPAKAKALLESGKLQIVQSVSDLPQNLIQPLFFKAWHGGTKYFDKFDFSKIGTGKGQLLFGHGMYVSDAKAIAEWYRDSQDFAKQVKETFTKDGVELRGYEALPEYFKPGNIVDTDKGKAEVIAFEKDVPYKNMWQAKVRPVDGGAEYTLYKAPTSKQMAEYMASQGWEVTRGTLYEVDVVPNPDEFLDWNKTLAEQSDAVKSRLPQDVDWQLLGKDYYRNLAQQDGGQKAASDYLQRLGIPGNRWETQTESGENATNFVVFDNASIDITAKYSVGGRQPWEMTSAEYETPSELKSQQSFYINLGGAKKVEVIRNPSSSDINAMKREAESEYGTPAQGDPSLRFTYDSSGNKYYWKAAEGIHAFVEPAIARLEGVNVNQNADQKPSHRSLVRRALYEGNPVPSDVLAEYPGLIEDVRDIPGNKVDDAIRLSTKYQRGAGINGLYDAATDSTYLVADMLDAATLQPTLAHEALHRAIVTDKGVQRVFDRFQQSLSERFELAKEGKASEIENIAAQRVFDAKTPAKDQTEEFAAYLVSEYSKAPESFTGQLKKLFDDMIAAVRSFLLRNGLDGGFIKSLSPADLAGLANYGLRVNNATVRVEPLIGTFEPDSKWLEKHVSAGNTYHGPFGNQKIENRWAVGKPVALNGITYYADNAGGYKTINGYVNHEGSQVIVAKLQFNAKGEVVTLAVSPGTLDSSTRKGLPSFQGKGVSQDLLKIAKAKFGDSVDTTKVENGDVSVSGAAALNKFNGASKSANAEETRPTVKFEVSPPEQSPMWRRWFGKSKMVSGGKPIRFYHGTSGDFTIFDKTILATNTNHPSAGLGFFFTRDKGDATNYGGKVTEVFLSVEKPFVTHSWEVDQHFTDTKGAEKYRKELQALSYDGIYLKDAGYAIAFEPNQIKLTSNTSPTFGEDVRFSRNNDPDFILKAEPGVEVPAGESLEELLYQIRQPVLQKVTRDAAIDHLKANFGVGIDNLINNGTLNFTRTKEGWPEAARNAAVGDEEAVYVNGKVYIDLSHTPQSRLNAVLLHEIGEHFGLRTMLGAQAYQSLQQQIANRAKIAGSRAEAIWNRVEREYPHLEVGGEEFISEVIAKLGEENPKAPWFRRLLSQVKAFLLRMGLSRGIVAGTITENDLHDLLITSLRSSATQAGREGVRLYGGEGTKELEAEAEPAFSRNVLSEAIHKIATADHLEPTLAQQGLAKINKMWDAVSKQRFAFYSVRHLVDRYKFTMGGLAKYEQNMQARRTLVDSIVNVANRLVSNYWKKMSTAEQRELASVMHASTLSDYDASLEWTGVQEFTEFAGTDNEVSGFYAYTQEKLTPDRRMKIAEEAMKLGALPNKENPQGPKDYVHRRGFQFKDKAQAEKLIPIIQKQIDDQRTERSRSDTPDENVTRMMGRKGKDPVKGFVEAHRDYLKLNDAQRKVYSETSEMHNVMFRERLVELEKRIADAVVDARKRAELIASVREKFESSSLQWYYAPLSRFGNFWFYGKDKDGTTWFRTFESKQALELGMESFAKNQGGKGVDGGEIAFGTQFENINSLESGRPSDSFVTDVITSIDQTNMDGREKEMLQDQIYQMYLATLPDVSVRHNSMHRQGTAGFEEDAMRSFSSAIHHGANQLANMRYGSEMRKILMQHKDAILLTNRSDKLQYEKDKVSAIEKLLDDWDTYGDVEALKEADKTDSLDELGITKSEFRAMRELLGKFGHLDEQSAKESLAVEQERIEDVLNIQKHMAKADTIELTQALDELVASYDRMVNYNSSAMDRVAMWFNQGNFLGMLGFSLSSGLVNLLQTPGVAMPISAGKFGISETLKAYGQAYNEFRKAVMGMKLDEDGNISISEVLKEKLADAEKRKDSVAIAMLKDEIAAMQVYKDGGDVSRTQTFDLTGVAREGYIHGGRWNDFLQLSGWMFHHGERFNREVTLMANYRLARAALDKGTYKGYVPEVRAEAVKEMRSKKEKASSDKNANHEVAISVARNVNNQAHLDYNAENAARIFSGWFPKIALLFKKYQQGMYWLWGKNFLDAVGKAPTREMFPEGTEGDSLFKQAKEERTIARQTFMALLFTQASFAGMMGLPMMGIAKVTLEAIANAMGDDDEPADLERDLRAGLGRLFGQRTAEVATKGFINAFTPLNIADRLDLSDVFFKEPMKEQEGRDLMTTYVAEVFGPSGGTLEKVAQGFSYLQDGYVFRAAEQFAPKFATDIIKAARYASEDARTLDNMPLKEMSAAEIFFQIGGFSSSDLERKYAERGYVKGAEKAITDTRTKIMREAAWAKINGEPVDMQKVRDWNLKHPEKPIRGEHISASVKGLKQRSKEREERGYSVDEDFSYLYDEYDLLDDE